MYTSISLDGRESPELEICRDSFHHGVLGGIERLETVYFMVQVGTLSFVLSFAE